MLQFYLTIFNVNKYKNVTIVTKTESLKEQHLFEIHTITIFMHPCYIKVLI